MDTKKVILGTVAGVGGGMLSPFVVGLGRALKERIAKKKRDVPPPASEIEEVPCMDSSAVWSKVRVTLKGIFSQDIFEKWIEPILCREGEGDHLELLIKNDFYKSWIEEHYLPFIRTAVIAAGNGSLMTISIEVSEDEKTPSSESGGE